MKNLTIAVICLAALCEARQNGDSAAPQGDTFKFETKVNVVLVPVFVRDAHGNAVGTLKKENFEVFDKDKPQTITGFTIQRRAEQSESLKDAPKEQQPASAPSAISPAAVVPQRFIVFLFDDYHLETGDLVFVKRAANKLFAGSLGPTDAAAVLSMSGSVNSGMTRDQAKLVEAVTSLREQRVYRTAARDCPDVSHYQADLILNKNDHQALETAVQDAIICANLDPRMRSSAEAMARSAASRSLAVGEQGTRATLQMIRAVAQKLATLPGQHTIILISSGFLTVTAEAMADKSQIIDAAAQANVTISALDARGLYTTEMDSSEQGGGSPMVTRLKDQFHKGTMTANEDVMAELADGTGGTYFHNNNDLGEGLRKLTLAPEYLYLLEFTPTDSKQDGSYHRLKVKVDQDGLKLQARRGYFALKASKKKS